MDFIVPDTHIQTCPTCGHVVDAEVNLKIELLGLIFHNLLDMSITDPDSLKLMFSHYSRKTYRKIEEETGIDQQTAWRRINKIKDKLIKLQETE